MIKFDSAYKVKNTPVPKLFDIVVEAGIDNYLCNCKSTRLSILPFNYMPGGAKSTGYIDRDIFNYTCDILNVIQEECFFNLNNSSELEIAKRYEDVVFKEVNKSIFLNKSIANKLLLPFEEKLNYEFASAITNMELFNIKIVRVYDDIKLHGNLTNEEKFLLLFSGVNKYDNYIINSNNKLKINLDYYDLNISLISFVNILYKIFMFYYSQSVRDLTISSALYFINYSLGKSIKDIECWDNTTRRYLSVYPNTLYSRYENTINSQFDIKNISFIKKDYTNSGLLEVTDRIDAFVYSNFFQKDLEVVTISKLPERFRVESNEFSDNVINYIGYLSYDKNNKSECVSLSLYATLKSDSKTSDMINILAYSPYPYTRFVKYIEHYMRENYYDIEYSSVFLDLPIKELFDKNIIEFKANVCYYTNNRKTVIPYADLIDKVISKDRKDYLYRIFCNLCFELNLNPLVVKNKMHIDFLKSYKQTIIG